MLQHSDERLRTWTKNDSVLANDVTARSGSNGSSLYRQAVVVLNALVDGVSPERRLAVAELHRVGQRCHAARVGPQRGSPSAVPERQQGVPKVDRHLCVKLLVDTNSEPPDIGGRLSETFLLDSRCIPARPSKVGLNVFGLIEERRGVGSEGDFRTVEASLSHPQGGAIARIVSNFKLRGSCGNSAVLDSRAEALPELDLRVGDPFVDIGKQCVERRMGRNARRHRTGLSGWWRTRRLGERLIGCSPSGLGDRRSWTHDLDPVPLCDHSELRKIRFVDGRRECPFRRLCCRVQRGVMVTWMYWSAGTYERRKASTSSGPRVASAADRKR